MLRLILSGISRQKPLVEHSKTMLEKNERNLIEEYRKAKSEAFLRGENLYKKIMETPESKQAATEQDLHEAIKQLKDGKSSKEGGGDKGVFRTYFIELNNLL